MIYLILICVLQPGPTDNEILWSKWLATQRDGQAEVVLIDGSRADIINDTHAYEVEWAKKWPEAIGQSLLYAQLSGKKPAIILLLRDKPNDKIYVLRCAVACAAADIRLELQQTRKSKYENQEGSKDSG